MSSQPQPVDGRAARHRFVALARRRPTIFVIGTAFVVRFLLALVVFLVNGGTLFGDDIIYGDMVADRVNGVDDQWHAYVRGLYWKTATFTRPLTLLYAVFGTSRFVGQCFVVVIGTVVALLVHRLALRLVRPDWALVAGLAAALLPSQVLWSSLVFKDSMVWLACAAISYGLVRLIEAPGLRVVEGLVLIAVPLLLLGWLRQHTLVIACVALLLVGLVGAVVTPSRRWMMLGLLPIAVLVPMAHDLGPAGYDFATSAGSLSEARSYNARGAETGIVEDGGSDEEIQARAADAGIEEDIRHLPKGLVAVVLRPFPGESSNLSVLLASIDSIPWYVLLALAAFGFRAAVRTGPAMWFALLFAAGTVVVFALVEGNIGTAYRHRGEVVWPAVLLAVIGAQRLFDRRGSSRAVERT